MEDLIDLFNDVGIWATNPLIYSNFKSNKK